MATGIGVDGCRAGWLVVQFDGSQAQAQLATTVADIRTYCPDHLPVWIDMPIGLVDDGAAGRNCDQLARRILSPLRHSSVFTPPCRAAVYVNKEESSAVNYAHTGKKLSRQSLNISPKIRELDAYLQNVAKTASPLWYEAHPEVTFAALQGLQPLRHNKKSILGQAQRHQLLKSYFANLTLWFEAVRANFTKKQVASDDILDALVLAVSAYLVASEQAVLVSLPEDPPLDGVGLPMRIVYASI